MKTRFAAVWAEETGTPEKSVLFRGRRLTEGGVILSRGVGARQRTLLTEDELPPMILAELCGAKMDNVADAVRKLAEMRIAPHPNDDPNDVDPYGGSTMSLADLIKTSLFGPNLALDSLTVNHSLAFVRVCVTDLAVRDGRTSGALTYPYVFAPPGASPMQGTNPRHVQTTSTALGPLFQTLAPVVGRKPLRRPTFQVAA